MHNKLRLEGLTLTVQNVARSVEFYGGTLGQVPDVAAGAADA